MGSAGHDRPESMHQLMSLDRLAPGGETPAAAVDPGHGARQPGRAVVEVVRGRPTVHPIVGDPAEDGRLHPDEVLAVGPAETLSLELGKRVVERVIARRAQSNMEDIQRAIGVGHEADVSRPSGLVGAGLENAVGLGGPLPDGRHHLVIAVGPVGRNGVDGLHPVAALSVSVAADPRRRGGGAHRRRAAGRIGQQHPLRLHSGNQRSGYRRIDPLGRWVVTGSAGDPAAGKHDDPQAGAVRGGGGPHR